MAVEQLCLKWNNFQTSILSAFVSLQVTEDLADVTLACEGSSVKAHKFILSACSPYFRSVFKDNPCSHPIVILKGVLYDDMVAVLNFMYHGEVLVSKDQLQTFLQTAETLQVTGLNSIADPCPKKKVKCTNSQPEELSPKKQKVQPKHKQPQPSTENDDIKSVCLEKIKVELEDVNSNETDMVSCPGNTGGSLLEQALENKDVPSILERSLTSHSNVKSPSNIFQHASVETVKQLYIPRKPPDEGEDQLKKEIDFMDHSNSNESMSAGDTNAQQQEVQPHHSSQCGNCPHCGKIYSNQSALKYHVRLVHSDFLNLYCCHLCPLTFDFRDCYKKHMIDAHSARS